MCGIIGCSGAADAASTLVAGLHALEYRGYDSAGIAYFDRSSRLCTVKAAGKITALEEKLRPLGRIVSHCGIGHTRWATHGAPTDRNSHPHGSARLQLVHNGIIENDAEIRLELTRRGYRFSSETDTEAAALLLDSLCDEYASHREALCALTRRLVGSFALAVLFADEPGCVYAVRRGSPLVIGVGDGESLLTSDLTAILAHTRRYLELEEGEIAILRDGEALITGQDGTPVVRAPKEASWSVEAVRLAGHRHFMHKEIFEEPRAIDATLDCRIRDGLPDFSFDGVDRNRIGAAERILFVACGTAYHASLVARRVIEREARVPVECEIASEFRYRDPIVSSRDVVIAVSQSGETADTLAALRLAKERGAYVLGIVNAVGSSVAREADAVLYTRAGPEIAVASTKAYVVQGALLSLFGVWLAMQRGRMAHERARELTAALSSRLPDAISAVLKREEEISALARTVGDAEHLFFIGRRADADAALEASLKLKEITYLHSEAYAAGELKHGTISLIESGTPVIAISGESDLRDKLISNVKEVAARGARVTSFAVGGDLRPLADASSAVFLIPETDEILVPLVLACALQLLAYHVALLLGRDVDQPRNLAKSVTVE